MVESEIALRNAAATERFALGERAEESVERNKSQDERYVRVRLVPTDVEVWFYSDGAQIDASPKCQILEEWDFRTPEEFIAELVSSTITLAKARGSDA